MNSSKKAISHIIAGDLPELNVPQANEDPFQALDDLMVVVEALCPTWPPRDPLAGGQYWLL